MLMHYFKHLLTFVFWLYVEIIYCQNENEISQVEFGDSGSDGHLYLKQHLKGIEKTVYDVLVNSLFESEDTMKELLKDYIYLLIDTVMCIKKNEADGFQTRTALLAKGGPIFLHNYGSQYFNDSSCKWNGSTGELSVIMKEIEDLYDKIVRLDTDNCPTAPTSVIL